MNTKDREEMVVAQERAAFRQRRANWVRILWGFIFVLSGVINLLVTLPNPQFYQEFAELTFFPFYRDLLLNVAVPNAGLISALVVVFELVAGVLVLSKGRGVRLGLLATAAWILFVCPSMGWYTIASPLLLVVPWWLLRHQQE